MALPPSARYRMLRLLYGTSVLAIGVLLALGLASWKGFASPTHNSWVGVATVVAFLICFVTALARMPCHPA